MEEKKITRVPSREALAGAVARGWCAPKNANKTMDEALAWAIVDELQALFAAPQQVDAVQAVPEGYVLARETVVEMPDGKNELGYTLLSGVGIFTRETEVYDAIKELNLPLGWVSMTTQQLLPGWMLPASPSPAVPTMPGVKQLAAQLHDGQTWTIAEQQAFAQVLAAFPNESSQGIISLGDAWKHGQAYGAAAVPEDDQRDAAAYRALNTPEIADFVKGVEREALHQRGRWGAEQDAGKAPEDWFWLLGYLGGKALHAAKTGNNEKALHHTISSAAALLNWHAAILGAHTGMRPGIAQPTDTTAGE